MENTDRAELVPVSDERTTMSAMLRLAIEKQVPVETMEKLVALSERMAAARARADFHEAMARFKTSCPPVPRRTENQQFMVTRNGTKKARMYASLEDIAATINRPASECGLSYRWGSARIQDGALTIACIVSHVGGHSETSEATLPVDSKAGCSDQQKMGTAMAYAQRYSLISALGLTSCDMDEDGNDIATQSETITESQAADLRALMEEVGANEARFLKLFAVGKISDMSRAVYAVAVRQLEAKRGARS